MPTRVRSSYPSVSGGGGGGGVVGTLEWGPDYGEPNGSDGVTYRFSSAADLDALMVANTRQVTDTVDLFSIASVNDKTITDTVSGALNYSNDRTITDTASLSAIATAATLNVRDQHAGDSLKPSFDISNSAHLSASVSGPPFWQSVGMDQVALSNTVNVPKPSGLAVGDLMVLVACASGDVNWTLPSGFTLIDDRFGNANTDVVHAWKIADSSDVAASTFTVTNSGTANTTVGQIHRVAGAHPTTPINVSAFSSGSATDPTIPAVTTTATNCMVFATFGHAHVLGSETHTSPAGQTQRGSNRAGTTVLDRLLSVYERTYAATGSTGTLTTNCDTLSADGFVTGRIAIAPDPAGLVLAA